MRVAPATQLNKCLSLSTTLFSALDFGEFKRFDGDLGLVLDLYFTLMTFCIAVLFWRQTGVAKNLGTNKPFYILKIDTTNSNTCPTINTSMKRTCRCTDYPTEL